MTTRAEHDLRIVAESAITTDRDIDGTYPPAALSNSVIDAVLDPANRDVVLAALGLTFIGYKKPLNRLIQDDLRRSPEPGWQPLYRSNVVVSG